MNEDVKHIMLVDDNKIDNFFHERVIRKYNPLIKITALASGFEALNYLVNNTEKPDIIFLDIHMPGMNGWEFIDKYKEIAHSLPNIMIVVMLTSSENANDKTRALKNDIPADFKPKPLTREILEQVCNKFTEGNI